MAYVPSFGHDVFVSYAHQHNLDGRVTAFHADLVKALQTNLGNRAYSRPEKWIFFDQRGPSWFLASRERPCDPIESRLIPVIFEPRPAN